MENEFEFGTEENQLFTLLSSRMKVVSVLLILAGFLTLYRAYTLNFPISMVIAAVLWIVLGIVFFFPVDNFKRIATTSGSDIKELMTAFTELKRGWIIAFLLLLVHRLYLVLRLF